MEYNKIREDAQVQQMILEKGWEAAQDGYYALENGAVKGYQAVEKTVVGGYKAIEHAVVSGYEKIENAFVDAFLRREEETVDEAKARLHEEDRARREEQAGELVEKKL